MYTTALQRSNQILHYMLERFLQSHVVLQNHMILTDSISTTIFCCHIFFMCNQFFFTVTLLLRRNIAATLQIDLRKKTFWHSCGCDAYFFWSSDNRPELNIGSVCSNRSKSYRKLYSRMHTTKALNPVNNWPVAKYTVLTKSQTKAQFRKKNRQSNFILI